MLLWTSLRHNEFPHINTWNELSTCCHDEKIMTAKKMKIIIVIIDIKSK